MKELVHEVVNGEVNQYSRLPGTRLARGGDGSAPDGLICVGREHPVNSIQFRSQVDGEGRVELRVPTQYRGQMLDFVVVFEPVQENGVAEQGDPAGWPSGAYAATAGAWQGEPLVREPQGEYEVRDPLP